MRSLVLYMALLVSANAGLAGPVDWQAARDAGLPKLAELAAPVAVPDVALTDPEGTAHVLSDLKGKVVLLNFWATWCAPCREEMPSLDALQKAKGGEDFEVLTVASGRNTAAVINRFFQESGVTALPTLTDPQMALARAFGVMAMPVTILIDAEGNEVARMTGDADWSSPAALALVDQMLAE